MHKKLSAAIKAVSKDSGEFEAILSMPTLDRDGEVIDAKAFEPLPEHITIDIDHGMSVATTVGSGAPFYEGDVLKFRGTFASTPLAQEVRTLVTEGHIRHMSVAYMNSRYEDVDGTPHLRKGELLNAAITGIPSNREASILAAKSFVDSLNEKIGARNSSKDAERIQGAHDLFVELGAKCSEHDDAPKAWGDAVFTTLKFADEIIVDTKTADTNPEPPQSAAPAADDGAPAAVDVARGLAALAVAEAEIALS